MGISITKSIIFFAVTGLALSVMANSDLPAKDSESSKVATDLPGSELTEQGKNIRGIYIPAGKVKSWKHHKLVKWIKRTKANAVLIDVKDDLGRVVFTDDLPYAKGSPNGYNKKLGSLITKLKENNIYTIARIVCFKDNLLSWAYPETAILNFKTGKKWKDHTNSRWVDPYSQLVRDHISSVAVGAKELGFDEIQLDYVRFPVDKNASNARYPNKTGDIKRYEAIVALLKQVDDAIKIPLSIDVFGLTAYHPQDSEALGQKLEYLAPYIDAISPMVYLANWPSHYWDSPTPEKTHRVIKGAIERIYERLGDNIEVRPLLQGFQWRAENWGYSFVVNQIDAANKGGASGYFFWNASGKYGTVSQVWKNMDREEKKKAEEILTAR